MTMYFITMQIHYSVTTQLVSLLNSYHCSNLVPNLSSATV